MSADGDGTRLDCGHDVLDLIDQVADGGAPDAHQRQCPYCTTALEELDRVWYGVRTLAEEPVQVPDDLVELVMKRVRISASSWRPPRTPRLSLPPRPRWNAVRRSPLGCIWIADAVIARVAHHAILEVPRVRPLSAAPTPDALVTAPGVSLEVGETKVAVTARIGVPFGPSLAGIADAVRDQITSRVESVTGMEVVAVDVIIDDVATVPVRTTLRPPPA